MVLYYNQTCNEEANKLHYIYKYETDKIDKEFN